jgi:HEAT repeat protein
MLTRALLRLPEPNAMKKFACVLFALSLIGCGSEPSHEDRGMSQWIKDLKAPGAPERKKAVVALGEIAKRQPGTAPAILNSLGEALKDSDPEVRSKAALQIGRQGGAGRSMAPKLLEAMRDPDKDVRSAAVQAYADIDLDNSAIVPNIVKLLDDKDLDVKKSAVAALSAMGPPAKSSVPALQGLLKDQKDFEFKRMINDAVTSVSSNK